MKQLVFSGLLTLLTSCSCALPYRSNYIMSQGQSMQEVRMTVQGREKEGNCMQSLSLKKTLVLSSNSLAGTGSSSSANEK